MRSDSRLPIVTRAAGSSRDDCALGSIERRASAGRCRRRRSARPRGRLRTRAAPVSARVARSRSSCCCGVMFVLYCRNSTSWPGATSPNSRLSTSTSASGGSASNDGRQAIERAGGARDDAVGLARHAHARLGFDVEERLDPRRVVEVDGAARDLVAASLEGELAAVDLGAAEQQRTIVGAAQLQVGAREEPRGAVPDFERRRRDDSARRSAAAASSRASRRSAAARRRTGWP